MGPSRGRMTPLSPLTPLLAPAPSRPHSAPATGSSMFSDQALRTLPSELLQPSSLRGTLFLQTAAGKSLTLPKWDYISAEFSLLTPISFKFCSMSSSWNVSCPSNLRTLIFFLLFFIIFTSTCHLLLVMQFTHLICILLNLSLLMKNAGSPRPGTLVGFVPSYNPTP